MADALWDGASERASARTTYPEARAALAAAARAGRISRAALRRACADLDSMITEMRIVELDARIAAVAGDLAERHALRGYDAVHLASALAIDDPELVVATWDGDLARAAVAAGRRAAPV